MDLNLHPRKETARYREIRDLLQGNTIVVCMGNRLTLAGFGMSMPIWSRVIAAVTTADEALEVVREHRPDLFFATEDLEQGYGIDLV
ncbi:MAG: LuxR family transcriptional regulator, partial [Synechococcus sp. CPC35]|nr:LuxR family transcriptional regulator [Synechococcus sp. CPC35]